MAKVAPQAGVDSLFVFANGVTRKPTPLDLWFQSSPSTIPCGGEAMVYQGTVQNGVVILPAGVQLPEGSPVRVELIKDDQPQMKRAPKDDILFRMHEFAVDTGIPDLSVNIDHYLYGHPKVTDEE
jgi:hypothetical protein